MTLNSSPLPVTSGKDRVLTSKRYGDLETFSDPGLDDIAIAAASLCDAPVALVTILDDDRVWFTARVGTDQLWGPLVNSGCAQVIAHKAPVVIPDMTADRETRQNIMVCGVPGLRFYAGYPLFTSTGDIIGSLCVVDLMPRLQGLRSREADGLAALARQAMRVLELRRQTVAQERRLVTENLRAKRAMQRASKADAERQKAIEHAIRHETAGTAGGIGIFDYDLVTETLTVSAQFCHIGGLPVRSVFPVAEWLALVPREYKNSVPEPLVLRQGGAPLRLQYRICRADNGEERWVLRQGILEHDEAGLPVRLIGTLQDVTPEKNASARLGVLLAIGDALRGAESRHNATESVCALIGTHLDVQRVGFAEISTSKALFSVEHAWCASNIGQIAGDFSFAAFPRTSGFLREGAMFILEDVSGPSWMNVERDSYQAVDVQAQVLVPMMIGADLVGCLFVHSDHPRIWTVDETSFLQAAADQLFVALGQWRARQLQNTINHEILHRLKNTLAIVQSLAHQGFRGLDDTSAIDTFTSRLIALSKAHDLLLCQNWQSTDLASLAHAVFSSLGILSHVSVTGSFLLLGPDAAVTFSMLLHELGTNAIKHGALSTPAGTVQLSWTVSGLEPDQTFDLVWQERDGPAVIPPQKTGFGVRLLKNGLARYGHMELHYRSDGLYATLNASVASVATL